MDLSSGREVFWLVLGLALALIPISYGLLRPLVTLVHECGHALVAFIAGRRLTGIRIRLDTSGETVSSGPSRGAGVVATLMAGYPAPVVLALAAVAAVRWHVEAGLLAVIAVVLLGALVLLRNLYALVVLVVAAFIGVYAVYTYGESAVGPLLLVGAGFFAVAGLRGSFEQATLRGRGHDAAALARITVVPTAGWQGIFVFIALCGVGSVAWIASVWVPQLLWIFNRA